MDHTNCRFKVDNNCNISTNIINIPVPLDDKACNCCANCKTPFTINAVTISRAVMVLRINNKDIPKDLLTLVYQNTPKPGTELKKLISWFPLPNTKGCKSCRALEGKMNSWGVEICEKKKPYIIKKLQIAAKRRNIPFSQKLVTVLIDKAIRNCK